MNYTNYGVLSIFVIALFLFHVPVALGQLRFGFYNVSCPRAESIVRDVVRQRFSRDRTIPAAFLRMHFHDCFVRGCDASILIDSTRTRPSEKSAGPNLSVRGFDIIDQIKTQLEAQCPSTVSCADIIALATRDSVALVGGASYSVPTGRRDGLVSNPDEVLLPGPTISVDGAIAFLRAGKLTTWDTITLLGAHTVGVGHCGLFQDRLSNFQGTGRPDPSMDPALASRLRRVCAAPNDPSVGLDQNTSMVFDNKFFHQIRRKKGILQLDQRLASDRSTRGLVALFESNNAFFKREFARSIVKMGKVDVLTGRAGEIRKNCRVFNRRT